MLDELTILKRLGGKPATLFSVEGSAIRCLACAHRCLIHSGRSGICKVRWNEGGILNAPHGYVASMYPDPVEKKPFFHFLPGSIALTFGMLGCNFHCDFCQNWFTSQVGREGESLQAINAARRVSPEEIVREAIRSGARSVVSSYNEPFITAEWANDIFSLAKRYGLRTGMVSNGYATPEALDHLAPNLDALKVDLKCYRDKNYRTLGGVLRHVEATIQNAVERGIWVEVVTLVIPEFNDSDNELYALSRAISAVSANIPWHVTAYHPDYKRDTPSTQPDGLIRAAEIGLEAGLRYVYAGNLHGKVSNYEDTLCPRCQKVLVQRTGFRARVVGMKDGKCATCGTVIPGVW